MSTKPNTGDIIPFRVPESSQTLEESPIYVDNVVSLDQLMRKRQLETVIGEFTVLEVKAMSIATEFAKLVEIDPNKAIAEISIWSDKIRAASVADGISVGFAESIGGPNIDNTSQIANILAAYYDRLNVEQRKSFIASQVSYLNMMNSRYSQMHVGRINNPSLIRDITINAPLYWPGLDVELDFFESKPDIEQFNDFMESCNSIGLLAYTILLNEAATSLPIKQSVRRNSPELLSGAMDFAAARAYHYGASKQEDESEDIVQAIERYLASQFLPEFIDPIRRKVAEAKWIHIDEPHFPFPAAAGQRIQYIDGELSIVR